MFEGRLPAAQENWMVVNLIESSGDSSHLKVLSDETDP